MNHIQSQVLHALNKWVNYGELVDPLRDTPVYIQQDDAYLLKTYNDGMWVIKIDPVGDTPMNSNLGQP